MMPSPSGTPLLKAEADGSLSITVYRKPTHTDQYLQWDSQHHLSVKFSVISTLTHRNKTVCSNPEHLCKEMDHLRKALIQCKYPKWALARWRKGLTVLCTAVLYVSESKGCLGVRCHIYIYTCMCTTINNAHLQVLFSSGVSWNKEVYNMTVFNRYDSFITTLYLYFYNTLSYT